MNKTQLEQYFNKLQQTKSDINEHLQTLKNYARMCDHITEMGVRSCVSTWSFISGYPKKLISYDITNPPKHNLDNVKNTAKTIGVNFSFIKASTLDVSIEKTDLLFIDTHHSYLQLSQELSKHANNVNKYIILHDTELFGHVDQRNSPPCEKVGLLTALTEFLHTNKKWRIKEHYKNNNGLTILEKEITQ